jgi:hypothetical protein
MEMLSPNFSRAEFEHSETAVAHGIVNVMGSIALANARSLCANILEPLRRKVGRPLILTSGFRSLPVNRLVGSADTSQHVLGQAADINDGRSRYELAQDIAQSDLDFDQLILEAYHLGDPLSGWVHVSRRPNGPQRRQILTIPSGRGQAALSGLRI